MGAGAQWWGCPQPSRNFKKKLKARSPRGRDEGQRHAGEKEAPQVYNHATGLPAACAACAARHSASMAGRSAACRISYVRAYGADASKTVG